MNTTERPTDPWDSGELGRSLEHAEPAPREASLAADDASDLQLISIRLQKGLLKALKLIADHHGLGYQPMIRDLLNRFAKSELRLIMDAKLRDLATNEDESKPVSDFLERERKDANG